MSIQKECPERVFDDFLKKGESPFDYEKILIRDYKKRILSYLNGNNPIPYEIEIQPSAKCNANCYHCWAKDFKKLENKLEEKENADKIIERILDFKDDNFSKPKIKFCGSTGEPLMNPLTTYFIDNFYTKRKTRLFTNGIMVGEKRFDKRYLSSLSKLDMICLSLDAGTTETFWGIKPGAEKKKVQLEEILNGMLKIKNFNPKLKFNVSYVIAKKNYKEILLAAEKVKKFGADLIRYRIDLTAEKIPEKTLKNIWWNLKIAKNFEDENFQVIPIHNEQEVKEKNKTNFGTRNSGLKCFTNFFWSCVGPDGKIYPCGHIVNPETENYGSLLEESFSEIWNGEKRKNARKCLPGKLCNICSPFSLRTNKFMNFLDSLEKEKSFELVNNFNKINS